jgi:hypothetical protein
MKRAGSRNRYFVRRIPADVSGKVSGLTLALPVGEQTQAITITPRTQAVRVSLRTDNPAEVKSRQATVDAYLESVWQAHRNDTPVTLAHRQVTALAGELYRSWAGGDGRERSDGIEHDPDFLYPDHIMVRKHGKLVPSAWRRVSSQLDAAEWEAAEEHLERINVSGEPVALEKPFGALVDRLLLARGIGSVDQPTRDMLLTAFWLALKDAFASRKRNAEGDYSDDPAAKRFPAWIPLGAQGSGQTVSLKGLVEAWWKGEEYDRWSDPIRFYPKPPKTFSSLRIPRTLSESLIEADKSMQAGANIAACVMFGRSLAHGVSGFCSRVLGAREYSFAGTISIRAALSLAAIDRDALEFHPSEPQ